MGVIFFVLQISSAEKTVITNPKTILNEDVIVAELSLLKTKNADQEHIIETLRRRLKSHEDRIHYLEMKMRSPWNPNSVDQDKPVFSSKVRQKRPAQLQPINFPRLEGGERGVHKSPSSCDDLNQLGHTFNAIYWLNAKDNISKIEVVFCDFQPFKSQTSVMEKRVGFIDVKASPGGVYFYCQKANTINKHAEIKLRSNLPPLPPGLRFESIKLNLGRGMNESTGIFTAPKPGVYHFQFFAQKSSMMPNNAVVHLRCNGRKEATSVTSTGLHKFPVVIHSTLKLRRGDKIDIFLEFGYLDHTLPNTIHFSGFLLKEDILLQ